MDKNIFHEQYRSNLDSIVAFVWISAIMRTQQKIKESELPLSVNDAALELIDFMGDCDDDSSPNTIKQRYYRMLDKQKNRRL